jgi:flagellar protein FliS
MADITLLKEETFMYANAVRSYRQASFFTANPVRLVLMCYDGAISSLKLACDRYIAKDYEAKARALQKTIDIIHEMNASLDLDKGGDIARNLRSLYHYMSQTLTEADLKKDIEAFHHVISMLEELDSAWREIACSHSETVNPAPYAIPVASGNQKSDVGKEWSV